MTPSRQPDTSATKAELASKTRELRTKVRGTVLLPADPAYDSARKLWNAMIDRRPEIIVQARDVTDVVEAVRFAKAEGVPVGVRGGGHGVAGAAMVDGGLVVDLSLMRAVRIDPSERIASVQGGALWGDVDHASQLYGLAVPGGLVSTTGVGGFTLGGGVGWASRLHGLACDNLVGAEVVTAAGEVVRASAKEHADLLWALRGGGGNLGVVTEFTFRLHPTGPIVYGGFRVFPGERARELLGLMGKLYGRSPRELNALLVLTSAPPAPFLPPEVVGHPIALLALAYLGPVETGPEATREIREIPGAVAEHVGPVPYTALQSAFDEGNPAGIQNYWKSIYADEVTPAAIDTVVQQFARVPSPMTEIHLQYFGGRGSKTGEGDSAVGNRSSPFLFNFVGKWTDPLERERNVAYIRKLWEAIRPHATGGVYVNFLADATAEELRSAHGEANWRRLAEVKRVYDPENLFRSNPRGGSGSS